MLLWSRTHGDLVSAIHIIAEIIAYYTQQQNRIDYILWNQRWRSFIQSAITRLGADCGSHHEFLIAKFRMKFKKIGKTTRPFRYDLNQIPNNYTVEATNRFKGLDLMGAWWTMDGGSWHCTGDRDQDHPQEKEMQNSCLRRPYK